MNNEFKKWFESIMYRPIDPFLYKHYKNMNDEIRKNQIINYSEEVKNGMKIFKKKKVTRFSAVKLKLHARRFC